MTTSETVRARTGDRILALFFDLCFSLSLFEISCVAAAAIEGAPLDFAIFSLAATLLLFGVASYHGLIAGRLSFKSPGEQIVRDARTVGGTSARSRALMVCAFWFLLSAMSETSLAAVVDVPGSAHASRTLDPSTTTEPLTDLLVGIGVLWLLLRGAYESARGARGWLIGGGVLGIVKLSWLLADGAPPAPTSVMVLMVLCFAYAIRSQAIGARPSPSRAPGQATEAEATLEGGVLLAAGRR